MKDKNKELCESIKRCDQVQGGYRTFFDRLIQDYGQYDFAEGRGPSWVGNLGEAQRKEIEEWLSDTGEDQRTSRFMSFGERKEAFSIQSIGVVQRYLSQGFRRCQEWRSLPIFKSVYDIAIYMQLIQELRPRSIFEIGSACGGSAVWFADQAAALGLNAHVYSMDINPPLVHHP